jgi:hypothetical protein
MGKNIKGNSNIFGIEKKTEEASGKYKEFDDLDDDDRDE